MVRLFCPNLKVQGERIILEDQAQLHYLRDVLRLKPEEKLTIFNAQGQEYSCLVEGITQQASLRIVSRKTIIPENKVRVSVACAIPKKAKMDEIVDKLTQLGVERIIPLKTIRTEVKLDQAKEHLRRERWQKIALTAAQQSQRSSLPEISAIKALPEVLAGAEDYDLLLIPHLAGRRQSLKAVLEERQPKNIFIFIGPEGDFTPEEVKLVKDRGGIPVTLGDLVLRVDTAAIAIAGFIQLYANH